MEDDLFQSGAKRRGLQWYDYLIFVATLVISLGIGIYNAFSGGGQKTTKQYLMANRSLGVVPVALSMFMSYISAVLILGNTAEMYQYGPMQWVACMGSTLAYISTVVFLVPLFYPLKITSAFKYLEMRYNSQTVKLSGTLLMMLSQVFYMGIAMFSPATALEAVTGFPVWASILATGVIATIYTSIGGMKAVIWTDVFQAVVYLGGVIAVLIAGSVELGGFGRIWDINVETGRLGTWDFTFSPLVRMSFWSALFGRFVSSTQTMGTGQVSVQRYLALPNMNAARWTVALNIPLVIMIYTLTCMAGLVVFAYYHKRGCDPLRSGEISSSNQLLPYFIVESLHIPGLSGLFVSVLFSGALSTLSSSLNALSAVTWKDLLEWKFKEIAEERKTFVTKVLVIIFGAISIGFAFLVDLLGGHVLQAAQSFVSGVAGPLLGLHILGAFFPFANWIGAVVGAWTGLAMAMVCTVGNYVEQPYQEVLNTTVESCPDYGFNVTKPLPTNPPDVNPLFRISYMWYAGIGTVTCVVIGILVSLLTKKWAGPADISKQDPRLIIPVFDRIMWCLPLSIRRALLCNIRFDELRYNADGSYADIEEDQSDIDTTKDPQQAEIGYQGNLERTKLEEELGKNYSEEFPNTYSNDAFEDAYTAF